MAWGNSQRTATTEWRKLRKQILERDGHRCTRLLDGKRCTAPATQVDHIVPKYQGGTDQPSNLASLCTHHHQQKTKQESAAARWPNKTARTPEPHPGTTPPKRT